MTADKFDRDLAFSMDIQDPDNLDDKSEIIATLVIDDQFFTFKTSSIYRMLTATTIDPENRHPETRHSYVKLYAVGSSNSYVARMILQFYEILRLAFLSDSERFISHVWRVNKILLECESSQHAIYKHVMELVPKCDEIIALHKIRNVIPALPQVEDLDKHVEQFLNNAKLFLVAAFELLNIFYKMPFDSRTAAHFNQHQKWIEKNFGMTDEIFLFLKQNEDWINVISGMRNAIQHPEPGQKVEVQNFMLNPGNKASAPSWRYDLTKDNIGRQSGFSDLVLDLNSHLEGLLIFFENLLILCVKKELQKKQPLLDIYKKRTQDAKCPIVFEIGKI